MGRLPYHGHTSEAAGRAQVEIKDPRYEGLIAKVKASRSKDRIRVILDDGMIMSVPANKVANTTWRAEEIRGRSRPFLGWLNDVTMQVECRDIQQEGMAAHRERISTCLIEFSILNSMPPTK